jgi:MSHA biogenesis protein MshM
VNYLRHFGLREAPFGITPDTSFFCACRSTQEALNTLLVAVSNGEGFIKITGEVGTGKTLLCRKFLATLDSGWVTAYIPNPAIEPRTLLLELAEELGGQVDPAVDQHYLLKGITRTLLALARQRKRVVLCMDESQAMPIDTLEALRLLTNLETEKRKLLQVVLFGQPELDRKLASESIRQLRQRITFQYDIKPLAEDEVGAYVNHRLGVAGYLGQPVLTRRAVRTLRRASMGVPRLVNILSHKALLLVYGEGGYRVEPRHVRAAAQDTPAAASARWWWPGLRRPRAAG